MPATGNPGLLKDLNHRAVFEAIAVDGPQSRVALAERLKLSQASVSRVVEALIHAGLVIEGRRLPSAVGRRQTLLELNPEAATVAGVSVRPNRLEVVLADLKGQTLCRVSHPYSEPHVQGLVGQIERLIGDSQEQAVGASPNLAAVSVGIAGAWDSRSRRVHSAPNLSGLEGADLLGELQHALPLDSGCVQVENDVNFAALGELAQGAGNGYDSLFYLYLGSGVGGGVVINRTLHHGLYGFSGEIGYIPVPAGGAVARLEDLVSSAALDERARSVGVGVDANELIEAAAAGQETALRAVEDTLSHLAIGVCSIVSTIDPDVIVIGGSVGKSLARHFLPRLEEMVSEIIPVRPPVVRSQLDDSAHLHGAIASALAGARHFLIQNTLSATTAK